MSNYKAKSPIISIETGIMWLMLSILAPLSLLSFSSLKKEIINLIIGFVKSFNAESLEVSTSTPMLPVLPIILFICGIIFCVGLIIFLQAKYTAEWFSCEVNNIEYRPKGLLSTSLRLLNWNLYRFAVVLAPLLLMGLITMGLMFLAVQFFNFIAVLMGFSLGIIASITIFTSLLIAVCWLYAGCMTIWKLITSSFGSVIAISEPELRNSIIFKRSERLAFNLSGSIINYAIYLIFIGFITFQILITLAKPEIISIPLVIVSMFINIAGFLFVGKLITTAYNKSYKVQLAKISVQGNKQTKSNPDISSSNNAKYSIN